MRNPEFGTRTQRGQHREQQVRRGDAVHVVVAVHQNALAALEGLLEPRHRRIEPAQLTRIEQIFERRLEKSPGGLEGRDAAADERLGRRQRGAQCPGQFTRGVAVTAGVQRPRRGHGRRDHESLAADRISAASRFKWNL